MRVFILPQIGLLPSVLHSSSEVANYPQTKKHLWCFSQKSLKKIHPLVSRAENVSLPLFSAVFLWSILKPFPHGVSTAVLTGAEGVIITPCFQAWLLLVDELPLLPLPQFSWNHTQWGQECLLPMGQLCLRALPGQATGSCHSSGWSALEWRCLASGRKGPNPVGGNCIMPAQKGDCRQPGEVSSDRCGWKGGAKKVCKMAWVKTLTFPCSAEIWYLIQIKVRNN